MKKTIRIKAIDRPGSTFNILSIINSLDINILTLEVKSELVHVQLDVKNNIQYEKLLSKFTELNFILSIDEDAILPTKLNYMNLLDMFNFLEESIVISSLDYKIIFSNDTFKKSSKNIKSLKEFFSTDTVFNEIDSDRRLNSFEALGCNRLRYIVTIRPYESIITKEKQLFWVLHELKNFQKKIPHNQNVSIGFGDIIYSSEQMNSVIELAKKASETNLNVLIRGESGVGKELIARSIHNESIQDSKPFIAINCAAIPDSLLESELFGYEEGTFTGSKKTGKAGLFELANTGTIFLDEIGDMPYSLQSKLLRVIETKSIRRLGGKEEIFLDIRIISATNQNLEERIEKKLFRLDLFYRLNAYTIMIPPLRYRKEDILVLAQHFLSQYSEQEHKLSQNAINELMNFSWEGNVRELEQCLQKSVILSNETTIDKLNLENNDKKTPVKKYGFDFNKSYNEAFRDFEHQFFSFHAQKKLSSRKLAKKLGLSHSSIANKIRKYSR